MKPREIVIIPVLNGFLVQIGCQKVVVNSIHDLTEGIRDYYTNPEKTEKDWIAHKLNDTLECQAVMQSEPCLNPLNGPRSDLQRQGQVAPEREFSATERLLRR